MQSALPEVNMSNQSVAQRLHEQLWNIIAATKPGRRLPSEPRLAAQLGVSRATLREAMRAFETQGYIRRRQGSGTYVNQPPQVIQSGLEVLESIETLAQREGVAVDFGALSIERRSADSTDCQALKLAPGEEALCISRVIFAENRSVAYLVDIVPEHLISPEELSAGFHGSVLDLLLQRGEPPLMASRTEISAATASSQVARALGIQRGDVLLCFTADLYSADGQVVDHSYSYFLPGHFRFHVVRRVGKQERASGEV
jgi:GntR family transcriptional regulator